MASLRWKLVHVCALAVLPSVGAFCGIRPSFDLESCSWNATDILILAPTTQAGTFNVVETLKGELAPGALLELPDLISSEVGATKLSELIGFGLPFDRIPFEGIPPIGQTDRVIVFLRRHGALPEFNSRPDLPIDTNGWQPAGSWGDFRTSTIWMQDEETYSFLQTRNPGPTRLTKLRMSETELRTSIKSVLQLRGVMDQATTSSDPGERSRKLAALFRSEIRIARMSAFEKLKRGGAPEVNILVDLLSDQSLLGSHAEIVRAIVGKRVANLPFADLLAAETPYWSRICPALNPGWWNGSNDPDIEATRNHYWRSHALPEAIQQLNLAEAKPVVVEFAAAWALCPPLEEHERSNQIAETLGSMTSALTRS